MRVKIVAVFTILFLSGTPAVSQEDNRIIQIKTDFWGFHDRISKRKDDVCSKTSVKLMPACSLDYTSLLSLAELTLEAALEQKRFQIKGRFAEAAKLQPEIKNNLFDIAEGLTTYPEQYPPETK